MANDPTDDPDRPNLSTRLGDRLRETDATVALAESHTGGLLGARLTAAPGASDYFRGAVTVYDYDIERHLLGVPREELDDHGVVSAPVTRELARGARDVVDATWGVAGTGIAGPGGGTTDTPVGTVFVGVAHAAPWGSGDSFARARRYEFDGGRATVRAASVDQALTDLLEAIEDVAGSDKDRPETV